LFDRIVQRGHFSEQEALELTRSLSSALRHLHSIGIVHRDLKPENLVYKNKSEDSPIKITDFGLAKLIGKSSSSDLMTSSVGTLGYMAPEILMNKPYTAAVDLWSLGVIIYILLCGSPPFYDNSYRELYSSITRAQYCFPDHDWSSVSEDAKHVIFRLLTVDANDRMTLDELDQHPWMKGTPTCQLGTEFRGKLKVFVARKRLRKCVLLVLMLNRLVNAIDSPVHKPPEAPPQKPRPRFLSL
jgi:calcium/calmodulin-dependent protein kinase I